MRQLFTLAVELLKRNKVALWLTIITITLLWGYAWVIMKQALQYMGPFTFTTFRFFTGAFALFIIVYVTKQFISFKTYWKELIVQGVLQTTIAFALVMGALQVVEAGKSSVLLYSMPIWSSLFAMKWLNEKLSAKKWLGLFLGFFGLITIVGWDFLHESYLFLMSELLIILGSISWALSNIYFRRKLAHLPKVTTSAFQMFFGAIGLLLIALLFEWGDPIILNSTSIIYILFTGLLASALSFTVWFVILSLIDMASATISTLLVPVFGLFFSALVLNEPLTGSILIGAFFIITGIIISQLKNGEEKDRDK